MHNPSLHLFYYAEQAHLLGPAYSIPSLHLFYYGVVHVIIVVCPHPLFCCIYTALFLSTFWHCHPYILNGNVFTPLYMYMEMKLTGSGSLGLGSDLLDLGTASLGLVSLGPEEVGDDDISTVSPF